jgi:hypothetical protein
MDGFVAYIGLSLRRLSRLPLPLKNYCNATCRDEVSLVSVSGSSLRGARFGTALLPCSGTSVIRISDDELVTNTYIKEDKASEYIMFKGEDEKKEEKLYLEDRPIAFQRAILCRGAICYRAERQNSKRWEFVVKLSWRSNKRRAEGGLLRLGGATVPPARLTAPAIPCSS